MIASKSLAAVVLLLGLGTANAADVGGPTIVTAPSEAVAAPSKAACSGLGVLGHIRSRFDSADRNTFHRGVTITSIGNPRPSNHPYAEPGLVKRDYCMADATMSNGKTLPVYYVIEHGLGFASIGRNVDFCVSGRDPWHVHDGDCRTVR